MGVMAPHCLFDNVYNTKRNIKAPNHKPPVREINEINRWPLPCHDIIVKLERYPGGASKALTSS